MNKTGLETLIGECTAYDFKLMLEERIPKSWLKSVSIFANGLGGLLLFDIDGEGNVRCFGESELKITKINFNSNF